MARKSGKNQSELIKFVSYIVCMTIGWILKQDLAQSFLLLLATFNLAIFCACVLPVKDGPQFRDGNWGHFSIPRQFFFVKATFHSTIFDIPMRPLREDQKHWHRFTR